jgi:hypothetical protein
MDRSAQLLNAPTIVRRVTELRCSGFQGYIYICGMLWLWCVVGHCAGNDANLPTHTNAEISRFLEEVAESGDISDAQNVERILHLKLIVEREDPRFSPDGKSVIGLYRTFKLRDWYPNLDATNFDYQIFTPSEPSIKGRVSLQILLNTSLCLTVGDLEAAFGPLDRAKVTLLPIDGHSFDDIRTRKFFGPRPLQFYADFRGPCLASTEFVQ